MKKRLAIVGVILAALAVALWMWKGRGGGGSKANGNPPGVAASGGDGAGATRAPRDKKPDPRTLALASFGGTVTLKGGGPVEGAQVCTRGWVEDLPQEETRDPRCVTTDARGQYVIDKLFVGTYSAQASAAKLIPGRWRGPAPKRDDNFKLKPGEAKTGVDIVLAPGGVEVRGTVQDIGGGIADAWVEVQGGQRWSQGAADTTRSGVDGTFTVWVAPGTIYANASADGYAPGFAEGRAPTQFLEILLTPESALAGTVVEAGTGTPVPDATVWLQPDWSSGDSGEGGWAITDASGAWRITRLRPGRYKPVAQALGKFGEPAASVLLGLGQVVEGIVIEVHAVQVVTGRVVTDDGSGCEDASVWGQGKTGRYISGSADEDDPAGTIRIEAVPPGTYELSVWCEGFIAEPDYDDVVVADKDIAGLEWKVHGGGVVVGTVTTKAGEPVAGADVSAQTVGGDPRGARSWSSEQTEDDGSYRLDGLAAGEVSVNVSADKHPQAAEPPRVTVTAGQESKLDIVLDDGGAIAGIVVDEDGTPVRGAQIRARGKKWSWGWGNTPTSGDDGTFTIEGLEAGSYRVEASRGWSDSMRKPGTNDDDVQGERVDVQLGQTAQVKLVVESRKGVIAGIVVDAAGQPVPDAYLAAEREADIDGMPEGAAARSSRWGWDRKPVVTDPQGGFELRELTAGKYTLRAYRRGGGEAIAEHVAVGTKNARLTIRATGAVSGTVTLTGGGAPDDLTVSISDQQTGFERSEQFFRTKGAFTLAELPPGKFKLVANAEQGRGELELTLAEGEQKAGLSIQLMPRTTVTGRLVELTTKAPVAGMQVMVQPQDGNGGMIIMGGMGGTEHISDSDGRFEVQDAPTGKVNVTAWPMEWDTSEYNYVRVPRTLPAEGGDIDVGEIRVAKRRTGPREMGGDFGMEFKQYGPEVPDDQQAMEIRRLRPAGPAEKAGVKVGDVIVSVDGEDITGENRYLAWSLMHVDVGTSVTFGFAGGATHVLVAIAPE